MTASERVGLVAVFVTAPDEAVAERLGRTLVEERLAACANLVPGVTSIFRWEGVVRTEAEVLIVLKTTLPSVEPLRSRVVELHPYDVPEFLAFEVHTAHEAYGAWVRAEVGSRP